MASSLNQRMVDVNVWAGTLAQMRAFVTLMREPDGVPNDLLRCSIDSMWSQIELDLSFHPETLSTLKALAPQK